MIDRISLRRMGFYFMFATLSLAAPAARAHGFAPGYLQLDEREGGRVEVLWKVPLGGEGGIEGREPVEVALPPSCRVVARREALQVPGAVLDRYTADCGPGGLGGATLTLRGDEGRGLDVLVSARFASGQRVDAVLRAEARSLRLPSATGASRASVASGYVAMGAWHIASGADHLLFVLGLLLLVRGARSLLATVTAFTAGHSVTLGLAALGLARVPQAPTEAVIALSVLLLAVELAAPEGAPPTLTRRAPWLVAGAFGLLHGFGFAAALRETGLPSRHVPLALLSFNVGVELGQLAFVALALGPMVLVARRWPRYAPRARRVLTYALGAAATFWTLARLAPVLT